MDLYTDWMCLKQMIIDLSFTLSFTFFIVKGRGEGCRLNDPLGLRKPLKFRTEACWNQVIYETQIPLVMIRS